MYYQQALDNSGDEPAEWHDIIILKLVKKFPQESLRFVNPPWDPDPKYKLKARVAKYLIWYFNWKLPPIQLVRSEVTVPILPPGGMILNFRVDKFSVPLL
jgi:hypothetical protein